MKVEGVCMPYLFHAFDGFTTDGPIHRALRIVCVNVAPGILPIGCTVLLHRLFCTPGCFSFRPGRARHSVRDGKEQGRKVEVQCMLASDLECASGSNASRR